MIHDPFYNQIIARLNGVLDPETFERCAADLLRTIYPTLVPIRGGSDAGMDGAIADGEDVPFPLISTTSEDVIGNLTRNLKSYLDDGGIRRKIILATSQSLTTKRRKNLFKRAAELGFVLIQVYDQVAIAGLLYRNPKWCLELLNLTGEPSALSVVPLTERPLLNHNLIGRDTDYEWLCNSTGDRLLVGQPGCGKTYLLYKYAQEGRGLFVVSKVRGEIASALRSLQPEAIFVDDAQLDVDFLVTLKHLREELGANFAIIATSWEGNKHEVAEVLHLPETKIHGLELLTRSEIQQVIEAAGIRGIPPLEYVIVNQAEGRPGLAVTLTHLCLQGGIQAVWSADALTQTMLKYFVRRTSRYLNEILAAFSLGGDAGMVMADVAREQNLNELEVREAVVKLASGGIIHEVNAYCLSVHPAEMRYALIRDVFFSGAAKLSPFQLLLHTPSLAETIHTLIETQRRGANIPQELT